MNKTQILEQIQDTALLNKDVVMDMDMAEDVGLDDVDDDAGAVVVTDIFVSPVVYSSKPIQVDGNGALLEHPFFISTEHFDEYAHEEIESSFISIVGEVTPKDYKDACMLTTYNPNDDSTFNMPKHPFFIAKAMGLLLTDNFYITVLIGRTYDAETKKMSKETVIVPGFEVAETEAKTASAILNDADADVLDREFYKLHKEEVAYLGLNTKKAGESIDLSSRKVEEKTTTNFSREIPMRENFLTEIKDNNITALKTAAQIEVGKIVIIRAKQLLKPLLPTLIVGYLDSSFGDIATANMLQYIAQNYRPNDENFNMVADAGMVYAYTNFVGSFDFNGMLDGLMSGIDLSKLGTVLKGDKK